jgi:hypothetical protein
VDTKTKVGEYAIQRAVNSQYAEMAKEELYTVEVEDIFDKYLAAFPEGTNPIFRERTEHDCSTCKQFVRNLGKVVGLNPKGERVTVWDNHAELPFPYNVVAAKMQELVRNAPDSSLTVFRTKEHHYGCSHNYDGVTKQRWEHFHGKVGKQHQAPNPDTLRAELEGVAQVMKRGLDELRAEDFDTVLELIEAKALYRGEEHLPAIKGFQALQKKYQTSKNKAAFVWLNIRDKAARFRNTVIGTLLTDLAEGKELEAAVKSFESKVAPANYKRPTSLITSKMVDQAVETLANLGLSEAIERRMATLKDIPLDKVLFADGSVKDVMKGVGIAGLLKNEVKTKPIKITNAQEISGEDFLSKIIPNSKQMSLLVENRHLGNFLSLTTEVHEGAGNLFKWDNPVAWGYDGDVADASMRAAVVARGGRVDGVVRFTHQWNDVGRNASLMDLHVFLPGSSPHNGRKGEYYPSGQRVGWNNRKDAYSRGVQDVDYTNVAPAGYVPVENITFPSLSHLRDGKYGFWIHNWRLRQPTTSGFKAEIELLGQLYQYEYPQPLAHHQWVHVADATLKNGQFTIEHKLPTTTSSKEKWGIKTESLVPVDTLMLSPNHWKEPGVGNKHVIFVLKDLRNPDPVRGIFNEYLRGDLDKHRKVFEILGSKTKAQPTPDGLSGLGFSSTRNDTVTAVVDGRSYNIKF